MKVDTRILSRRRKIDVRAFSHFFVASIGLLALCGCAPSNAPPSHASATQSEPGALKLAARPMTAHRMILYRPSNSTFYFRDANEAANATQQSFGASGDIPVFANFAGSGEEGLAVYRAGEWFVSSRADGNVDSTFGFGGAPGDIPLAADIDGDDKADAVIFRKGEWIVRGTRDPTHPFNLHFGAAGDIPLLADFNGDAKIDLALFRQGQWLVDTHRNATVGMTFYFGGPADEYALAADWNRSGQAVPVLYRNGEWLIDVNRDGKSPIIFGFGAPGDVPLAISSGRGK